MTLHLQVALYGVMEGNLVTEKMLYFPVFAC